MNEPALFIPFQSTMPEDVVHPGKAEPRLHGAGPQPLRLADGARRARGARAAAARPAPVRHHARRLRRPPAPRAAVDGRQQSWWEHLWMASRSCRTSGCRAWRSAASTSAASTATPTPSCWRAGPSSASSSRSAATTRTSSRCRRSRGAFGEPWTGLIRNIARAADAAAAVPVRRVRGVLAHRRADPAAAAVRPPRRTRRPTPPTTSCCSATRCSWRRSRGRGSSTATSTSRRGRGCTGGAASGSTGRRTCSPTRRSGSRRCTRARTRRSRCGR